MFKIDTRIFTISAAFCLILFFSSSLQAQTTYKPSPGIFAGVNTLKFGNGFGVKTQDIGLALGYRLNNNFDLALNPELLLNQSDNTNLSLLNLGIIAGYTARFSSPFMVRSELSLYHSFILNRRGFDSIPEPSSNSAVARSSLFAKLPLSNTISILPNVGAFLGYGDYKPTYTRFELTQSIDGFVVGPQFGADVVFRLSDALQLIIEPRYGIAYNLTDHFSNGDFGFNFYLNF